eukprot:2257510-Amphidinium_carterae.1
MPASPDESGRMSLTSFRALWTPYSTIHDRSWSPETEAAWPVGPSRPLPLRPVPCLEGWHTLQANDICSIAERTERVQRRGGTSGARQTTQPVWAERRHSE